jgi:hypothetical protein
MWDGVVVDGRQAKILFSAVFLPFGLLSAGFFSTARGLLLSDRIAFDCHSHIPRHHLLEGDIRGEANGL